MRGQKGITLIALVITIIVMLILVTVTISIATQGMLFNHAGNAVRGTKAAAEGENSLGNGKINGDTDIQDFVNSIVTP